MIKKQKHLVNLILTALLSAVSVILGRFFSYNAQSFSIGLSFLPVMICAMLTSPLWGGVCGALADLVGALLFPFGAYFPGFTAVAFFMGALYGIIGIAEGSCTKRISFIAFSFAILLVGESVGTLLLNSLWLTLMYGTPYPAQLALRLPECIAYLFVKTAAAPLLSRFVLPPIRKTVKRSQ